MWYFHVAEGTGAMFYLPQRSPYSYTSLNFCTWYVISNTVSGYWMNSSRIKAIKSTHSTCKGSKTIRKKRMSEYLEAEKEVGTYDVTMR